jgi:hypothetical protein
MIQGAWVGVDTSDRFSGYRVDHNAIQDNTLFAIDAGSAGAHPSGFDHNSLRGNTYGLVSELTDDTLWPQPPVGSDRGAYARNLRNARVDHNAQRLGRCPALDQEPNAISDPGPRAQTRPWFR